MRDEARIDPFLETLGKFWHKHPDWRFGQIVSNAFGRGDIFYVEEREFLIALAALDEWARE